MAIASTFRYSTSLQAAGGALVGWCVQTLGSPTRPVAPLLGSRPELRLTDSGLSLRTDPVERPRFWHWGRHRLSKPAVASAQCTAASPLWQIARVGDEVQFGLDMTGSLSLALIRRERLLLAAGSVCELLLRDATVESIVPLDGVADTWSVSAFHQTFRAELNRDTSAPPYTLRVHRQADAFGGSQYVSVCRTEWAANEPLVPTLVARFMEAELVTASW